MGFIRDFGLRRCISAAPPAWMWVGESRHAPASRCWSVMKEYEDERSDLAVDSHSTTTAVTNAVSNARKVGPTTWRPTPPLEAAASLLMWSWSEGCRAPRSVMGWSWVIDLCPGNDVARWWAHSIAQTTHVTEVAATRVRSGTRSTPQSRSRVHYFSSGFRNRAHSRQWTFPHRSELRPSRHTMDVNGDVLGRQLAKRLPTPPLQHVGAVVYRQLRLLERYMRSGTGG